MEYGIAKLSLIPVRSNPSHGSEMITQLLFGELYSVTEKTEQWLKIRCEFDQYTGWIHLKQHSPLNDNLYEDIERSEKFFAAELVQTVTNHDMNLPVLIGSTLYDFDGMNFKIGKEKFVYAGKVMKSNPINISGELIKKIALKFLNSPYLWGGRSPFGIDCSGFTQIVFKTCGIKLFRDSYQQADSGKTINFIYEAKEGDIAFFDDEKGKIVHTGIILNDNKIIHASGKVRINMIDHYGIYDNDLKKYSHKLRIIRRMQ